jgi:hypothetical protein
MLEELRRTGPWVSGAAAALAGVALLAVLWSAGLLLLRALAPSQAPGLPTWVAAAICLLGAVAAAVAVPPLLRFSKERTLERALESQHAVWRTLGWVAPVLCILAAAVLLAGAGLALARKSGFGQLLHLSPGVPRFEDLDRACAVEADRFLCMGFVRYDLQGRLVTYGDWVVLRHGEKVKISAAVHPSDLWVKADADDKTNWSIELSTPHDWGLRAGLYTGADKDLASRPHFRLSLSGLETPEPGNSIPQAPIGALHWCTRQAARFRISRLWPGWGAHLRNGLVDFERSCRDDEGYWVTVGRIGYREPAEEATP